MKFAVLYLIITFALSQIKIVFKSKAEKDRNVRWLKLMDNLLYNIVKKRQLGDAVNGMV